VACLLRHRVQLTRHPQCTQQFLKPKYCKPLS